MTMVLTCIALALAQLPSRAFLQVLALGVALAMMLLAGGAVVFGAALYALLPDLIDLAFGGFGAVLLSWGGTDLLLAGSVLAMMPVATLCIGLLLDRVARAVEARHYPGLPPPMPQSLYAGLRSGINFLGLVIAVNVPALLLYALSGPLAPAAFWTVNGYLIGREYFAMAAQRRLGPDAARTLRRAHRGRVWLAGICMAIPLSLPLINLIMPVLAAASFTHLVQRLAALPNRAPPNNRL
jgi:CysZ protein